MKEKCISVSPELHSRIKELAKAAGMTMRGYMKHLVAQEEAK